MGVSLDRVFIIVRIGVISYRTRGIVKPISLYTLHSLGIESREAHGIDEATID